MWALLQSDNYFLDIDHSVDCLPKLLFFFDAFVIKCYDKASADRFSPVCRICEPRVDLISQNTGYFVEDASLSFAMGNTD
jgi:hypothetical protein